MPFLKITESQYKDTTYRYGLIVESVREEGTPTHRTLKSLGPINSEADLERARQLEQVYQQGEKVLRFDEIEIRDTREFGLPYAAKHVWHEHGITAVLEDTFADRKPEFDPVEITFHLAIARFYGLRSEHATHEWIRSNIFPPADPELQHLSRTLDLLDNHKDEIEQGLFEALDRWSGVETVFYDLTSTYFEGDGPELAEYGYSRDNRPDREQVVGVATADGAPITHHVWPGNTADSATLEHALADLRERFAIEEATFVADRGLITPDNLDDLEDRGWTYILGTNRRGDDEIAELITQDVPGEDDQRACVVKRMAGRRHVLCLNAERRTADLAKLAAKQADMEAELAALAERYEDSHTGRGRPMTPKGAEERAEAIVSRGLYTYEVNEEGETFAWELDEEKLAYEEAICGKYLLVTNADLEAEAAMAAYRDLRDIEWCFRQLKHEAEVRPIYHSKDRRVEGHIFVCMLTLLTRRLLTPETYASDDIEALKALKAHRLDADGEAVWMRSTLGAAEPVLDRLDAEKSYQFLAP
jgi:transposase